MENFPSHDKINSGSKTYKITRKTETKILTVSLLVLKLYMLLLFYVFTNMSTNNMYYFHYLKLQLMLLKHTNYSIC